MNWLGIDIGGANLKLSDGAEYAGRVVFRCGSDLAS